MKPMSSQPDPIITAIGRAGIMGITTKQLTEVTHVPASEVSTRLGKLAAARSISRVGRGLWVLQEHNDLSSRAEPQGQDWYASLFEGTFGLKIGRYQGEIQFNPNEELAVHRWWPYVQGFSAGFVENFCRRFEVGPGSVVLDPFCGSGTVPVVARLLGAKGIGIDMMPIAAFASSAKCEWDVDPADLRALSIAVTANRSRPTVQPPFLKETRKHFQPEILRALLRLKQNIWDTEDDHAKSLAKLAFASILVDASNLKRSPCLGYVRKRGLTEETPYVLFGEAIQRMCEDLSFLHSRADTFGPKPDIIFGNAGTVPLKEESVDLAITSPPYVNGMDYVMNYKLDMAWMDMVGSYQDLKHLRATMVACDNSPREAITGCKPRRTTSSDEWITSVQAGIETNIKAKAAYRRNDMGAIVTKYFDDLVPVIENAYCSLRPGGRFVVVNGDSLMAGTYVPGDMIFARLASRVGFNVNSFDIARVRRSGQRRGYLLRESITVLQKPR
jgi:DNA modification methylase